jgi:hypothetical protein
MKTPANIKSIANDLSRYFPEYSLSPFIIISTLAQELYLIEGKRIIKNYAISSAKNGTGNLSGSYQTPLGLHYISEKIGDNAKLGTIFKARINTHKLAKILHNIDEASNKDYITSRILRLSGLEEGFNKGGNVDSYQRYIYIHGTDEEGRLGQAVSHGCIRMANDSIIELFDHIKSDTLVNIID